MDFFDFTNLRVGLSPLYKTEKLTRTKTLASFSKNRQFSRNYQITSNP
jgi:hypothetical protein